MENKHKRVVELHARAYDMFPQKHKPMDHIENPFPMYSYERVASIFWNGFIEGLVESGMEDDAIESLLRSKDMRWMFDENEEVIEKFAKSLIKESMIKKDTKCKD